MARGDADIGLVSRAWAEELGLVFHLLAREAYGLLVRAHDLGDPNVVRICEVAQFQKKMPLIAMVNSSGHRDFGRASRAYGFPDATK